MSDQPDHFKGKSALEHVVEAKARGVADTAESHGTEIPGHLSAGSDAAREIAVIMMIVFAALATIGAMFHLILYALITIGMGLLFWKVGRAAWLGWSRLERLHRIIEQERFEIEHHRTQEREELAVLYQAKGFEGKLLDDVVDTLMADGDRLLRVMLEEELGFSLEVYEHPLKQALGAGIGAIISLIVCIAGLFIWHTYGLLVAAFLVLIVGSIVSSHREGNRLLPAIIWNVALGVLALGVSHFLLLLIFSG